MLAKGGVRMSLAKSRLGAAEASVLGTSGREEQGGVRGRRPGQAVCCGRGNWQTEKTFVQVCHLTAAGRRSPVNHSAPTDSAGWPQAHGQTQALLSYQPGYSKVLDIISGSQSKVKLFFGMGGV